MHAYVIWLYNHKNNYVCDRFANKNVWFNAEHELSIVLQLPELCTYRIFLLYRVATTVRRRRWNFFRYE